MPDRQPTAPEELSGFESRFELVSRRAFLKRSAVLGAAALLPGVLASCATDRAAFTTTTAAGSSTTAALSTTTTTTTEESAAAAGGFPSGGELVVAFTYAASSGGGQIHNPYVAVWVEDASGSLVATIALWFMQSQKGLQWLTDLRRWYSVDGSSDTIETVSGATRRPGDYAVTWDGISIDGEPVSHGDYYVCIEAAREHGPYSLIRGPITIGAEGLVADLPSNGELTNATVELVA